MSQFLNEPAWIKRIWSEIEALKSQLGAIATQNGEIRSVGGGDVLAGVLTTHAHGGTGQGGGTLSPKVFGFQADTELTIAAGVITVTQSHHTIDTESDAATDDVDTINGLVANQLYFFYPANDARTVVLKHGTGNVECIGNQDITLDDDHDFVWAFSPDGSTIYVGLAETGKASHAQIDSHLDAYNGSFLEPFTFVVTEAAGVITGTLDKNPSGDLTERFSDGYSTATSGISIALTAGSDTAPVLNYVYILQSNKGVLAKSTTGWPAAEHNKIAQVILQTAATTQTEGGALVNQFWNDYTKDAVGQGHHLHAWERLRHEHSAYDSGGAITWTITTNVGTPDNVDVAVTAAKVYQLHLQDFEAKDTAGADNAHVVNDSVSPYTTITDFADLLTDSAGGSMSGKYFNLVLWGSISSGSEVEHLFVNLPGGSYNRQADATADVSGFTNFTIPSDFRGKAFLISRITLRHQVASGGTWTSIQETDLRGEIPNIVAGGGTAAITTEFADSQHRIFDNTDPTKLIAHEASSISAATTRTITMPDNDVTLLDAAQPEAITGLWNFIASGLGDTTDYDLTVGDVATPDYGIIRVGNASLGRTSHNAASLDLDGTFVFRNMGGPVTGQIEFAWTESAGSQLIRFALPKSGVGNATYNPRSMLLAGPAVNDDDIVTVGYWQTNNSIFDNLACDTSGTGADLGVQNDLEVEGDIFTDSIKESTTDAGITIPDSVFIGSAESLVVGHTAPLPLGGYVATTEAALEVLAVTAQGSSLVLARYVNNVNSPKLQFYKTRQTPVAAHDGTGIVSDDDRVAEFKFYPDDGVDPDTLAAMMIVEVDDATPAAGDIGMAYVWQQMPGGGGAIRETMRLAADGQLSLPVTGSDAGLSLGTTTPSQLYHDGAVTVTDTSIAFNENSPAADTITDSNNGFGSFVAGDVITVSGSTSNDGTYDVVGVAAGTLTLSPGVLPLDEVAGDNVTITRAARLRLDSGTANGFMTVGATVQAFGSAINKVKFLNATAVSFLNALGTPIVKFSDAAFSTTESVEFATGVLNVNEAISISEYIDVDELATPSAPSSGTRRLFNSTDFNDLSVITSDSAVRSLENEMLYASWVLGDWAWDRTTLWTNANGASGSHHHGGPLTYEMRTGGTNGSEPHTYTGFGVFSPHSGTRIWSIWIQNDSAARAVTKTFRAYGVRTGSTISVPVDGTDEYIGWRLDDGDLKAVHCDGTNAEEETDTGVNLTGGFASAFLVVKGGAGSEAKFYHKSSANAEYDLVATHNTNMPAVNDYAEFYGLRTDEAVDKRIRVHNSSWRL